MAKRGGQCLLTPEITASLARDLKAGLTRSCSAIRAGISPRTLTYWMAKGRAGHEDFVSFVATIEKSERDAEARNVAVIQTAATKTWQAAAWWLERKFPESWSLDKELAKDLKRFLQDRKATKRDKKNGTASRSKPRDGA